ncbi:MAG: DNA-formamidopyrimidine glycosylase family protein [bacterium]
MPELPEATTISTQLSALIKNRILSKLIIKKDSIIKNAYLLENLTGKVCQEVSNYGKMVYFRFDNYWIIFHLALTGYLVYNPPQELYVNSICEFYFDNDVVVFGAKRMFEKIIVYDRYPFDKYGPDFRSIKPLEFIKLMTKHSKPIKVALMDQNIIAGIGNIYACEALFKAGILPTKNTRNITAQQYHKLYNCIKEIINKAIEKRGSTISDYIDAFGQKGEYQNYHQVYGKKNCPVCNSKIKTTQIQDRITYFCSNCQQ